MTCSALGLGTGRLRSAGGGLSERAAVRLIEQAGALGLNVIDTADSYGQGESERAIGRALRGRRDRFILATKAGFRFSPVGPLIRLVKPAVQLLTRHLAGARRAVSAARRSAPRTGMLKQDFTPAVVAAALEASLRRLQSDCVDLFFLHEATPEALHDGALWAALLQLQTQGKVRGLGVSSNDPAVLAAALDLPGLAALQTAVHPARPAALWPVLAHAAALGVGIFANQIFRGGRLLADTQIAAHAQARSLTPRQWLLAFALAAPGVSCALTGTTDSAHLADNVRDLHTLTAQPVLTWEELRGVLPMGDAQT